MGQPLLSRSPLLCRDSFPSWLCIHIYIHIHILLIVSQHSYLYCMSLTCGCEEVEDWPSVLIPRQERRIQLGQGLIKRGDTTVNNLRRGTYGVRTNEPRIVPSFCG
jgi:hypothetical protein